MLEQNRKYWLSPGAIVGSLQREKFENLDPLK